MDPITKTWKFKYDDERDPLYEKAYKGLLFESRQW